MAITTYPELKTAVSSWLHRSDLTANVPDFIAMAEWRVARDLRVAPLMATSSVTIAAAGSSVALPAGFLELVNVQISSGGAELQYIPPDTIDRVSGAGTPWVYTLIGSNIQVAPTWTAGGSLSMTYFKKETALTDAAPTNWYITTIPDTMLYAALLEAAPFLMNDNRISIWKDYYQNSISNINRQYGNVDPHKRMMQYADPNFSFNGNNAGAGA